MSFFEDFTKVTLPTILKKRNIGILLALGLLILWGLLRSCSHHAEVHKRVFLIGRDSTWYPQQLMGKERNLQAFTNDLMAAIAQETKLSFVWVETGSVALLEGLDDSNYDAAISSLRPNFVNQNKYVFSDLIFELGPVLIVQQNSPATSLRDMQGKTIGIKAGSNLIFNTIKEGGAHAYNILITTYDNLNRALESLDRNRIDGLIMDTLPAYAYTEGFYSGRLKIVTPPFTDEGLRLVALKDKTSEELVKVFDQAMKKFKENGTYDQLINKWNLINPQNKFLNQH